MPNADGLRVEKEVNGLLTKVLTNEVSATYYYDAFGNILINE